MGSSASKPQLEAWEEGLEIQSLAGQAAESADRALALRRNWSASSSAHRSYSGHSNSEFWLHILNEILVH